jgi:hypothetical protein
MPQLKLTKGNEELTLFTFGVRDTAPPPEEPVSKETLAVILAYNQSEAISNILKDLGPRERIFLNKKGELKIKVVLNTIDFDDVMTMAAKMPTPENPTPPEKQQTPEEFMWSLSLIADRYITSKRDVASVKRIINNILKKLKNEQPSGRPAKSS